MQEKYWYFALNTGILFQELNAAIYLAKCGKYRYFVLSSKLLLAVGGPISTLDALLARYCLRLIGIGNGMGGVGPAAERGIVDVEAGVEDRLRGTA